MLNKIDKARQNIDEYDRLIVEALAERFKNVATLLKIRKIKA